MFATDQNVITFAKAALYALRVLVTWTLWLGRDRLKMRILYIIPIVYIVVQSCETALIVYETSTNAEVTGFLNRSFFMHTLFLAPSISYVLVIYFPFFIGPQVWVLWKME